MLKNLTEEQFRNLPCVTLHYPCDHCGLKRDYGNLARDLEDYRAANGELAAPGKELYTALYLCGACHWKVQCQYKDIKDIDKDEENE